MIAMMTSTHGLRKAAPSSRPAVHSVWGEASAEQMPAEGQSPSHQTANTADEAAAGDNSTIGSAMDVQDLASRLDFIVADAILPGLRVQSKEAAIQALVYRLIDAGAIPDALRDEVLAAVLRREAISPTAIGQGIAIPHAKHPGVPRVVAAVASCPDGIFFGGQYGTDVHLIVLLVSPEDNATAYLKALSELSQLLLTGTRSP